MAINKIDLNKDSIIKFNFKRLDQNNCYLFFSIDDTKLNDYE